MVRPSEKVLNGRNGFDAHVKYDCTVRLTLAKIAPKAKLLILNYHDEVHG